VISGGRFVLGLGTGGADERIAGFGGDAPTVAALDEAVPLIRRLWSGEPVHREVRDQVRLFLTEVRPQLAP
jgi:alkanesulfonate monooxygenase SsuD/methylene tetrahydromethanopterin reductase-like flavin-dependent oxidoreductase (luciferase family)